MSVVYPTVGDNSSVISFVSVPGFEFDAAVEEDDEAARELGLKLFDAREEGDTNGGSEEEEAEAGMVTPMDGGAT